MGDISQVPVDSCNFKYEIGLRTKTNAVDLAENSEILTANNLANTVRLAVFGFLSRFR